MAQQIAQAAIAFEQRRTGNHVPKSVTVVLSEGTLVITLHDALSPAEKAIVLGTHGRSGLARAQMGSVAEDVLRNASCPVLKVKVPLSQTEPSEEDCSFHEGEVCRP